MRSVLSEMNTNLRQTLTLSVPCFTFLCFISIFHFSVPSDSLPNPAFRVLVKVLWYTYLLYERDSVNLKK